MCVYLYGSYIIRVPTPINILYTFDKLLSEREPYCIIIYVHVGIRAYKDILVWRRHNITAVGHAFSRADAQPYKKKKKIENNHHRHFIRPPYCVFVCVCVCVS